MGLARTEEEKNIINNNYWHQFEVEGWRICPVNKFGGGGEPEGRDGGGVCPSVQQNSVPLNMNVLVLFKPYFPLQLVCVSTKVYY